jgi:RHS repeat-associated protein
MVNIGSVIPAATRSGQSRFGVLRLRGSQYGRMTIRPYPPEGGTPNKDSGGVTRTHVYTYDDSGNMVHDENHAYGYDPENRLVLVRKSGPYGTLDYETITKYVYDGDHCIAEYNAYNQLKRKYIYGPCTDEPICLIDTMTSPAVTSYYHFDGLRSVVALTNSSGNTVEVYEYDVYGRVGATDANHPNRFMFTGREYDKETGLYYYRARYYNPQIGRFLQTDPVGYGAGMNLYAYCGNNSTNCIDPSGLKWEDPAIRIIFYDSDDRGDSSAANDPFWDVKIDISGRAAQKAGYNNSAEYIKALSSGTALLDKIMADMPVDAITGLKIYDRDAQVTIEGLWILGHGSTFGDDPRTGADNTVLHWTQEYVDMFAGLGQALDNNNGAGATIHLRSCSWDGQQALHKASAAAIASGHAVTVPLKTLVVDLGWNALIFGDAPYYCTNGFAEVTPIVKADGSKGTWTHAYSGYETEVDRPEADKNQGVVYIRRRVREGTIRVY